MNKRNVEALADALYEANIDAGSDLTYARGFWANLAESLAARGVLAPSALTDEECLIVRPLIHPANTGDYQGDAARWMRGSLECVARESGLTDDEVFDTVAHAGKDDSADG